MLSKAQDASCHPAEASSTRTPRSPTDFDDSYTSFPFNQPTALASISGPTYVTAQLLVQQVAYLLSDKIFSYSPPGFHLDAAVRHWVSGLANRNLHGYPPALLQLQARAGAGALALGYVFSPDFDSSKRHVPQSLLAPSGNLHLLRHSLDQLSLHYSQSCPFVLHLAAVDYCSTGGLVPRYDTALGLAQELGLALVATSSPYEAQHMALFATLLAAVVPTMHIYDGVRASRETLRVVDALDEKAMAIIYNKLSSKVDGFDSAGDNAAKAAEILASINHELGTSYKFFEYHGHQSPDVVLVSFGTVEAQAARQAVSMMSRSGVKFGAVNIRLYRPFVDEKLLAAIPSSARVIAVLGQVSDAAAVRDEAIQSALYGDVLAATTLSDIREEKPRVLDIKYSPNQILDPQSLVETLYGIFGRGQKLAGPQPLAEASQYVFWDMDDSIDQSVPTVIGRFLSEDSATNVHLYSAYDNLAQGGVVRTDIRASKRVLDSPYDVTEADVVFVGNERILKEFNVLGSIRREGKVMLKLSDWKVEDAETRLPADFRRRAQAESIRVFIFDAAKISSLEEDDHWFRLLLELSFLKTAEVQIPSDDGRLAQIEGRSAISQQCVDAASQALTEIIVPENWAADGGNGLSLPTSIQDNSFVGFSKSLSEGRTAEMTNWQTAARGLLFKEALKTQTELRPDLTTKSYQILVKENRRLTPAYYDRHIFHLEFDLGRSGLTYKIGEALGIHAENEEQEVSEFMARYGLEATALVQVPARADKGTGTMEVRTIQQALTQNVDIFGKPPKRFYEQLAEWATDEEEGRKLAELGSAAGNAEFKRRSELDMVTYADVLDEFPSARPGLEELAAMVGPLKRREYSIASAQAVTPTSVALMVVVVSWVDGKGRHRMGQATSYLSRLEAGTAVTVSVKPSVMKLPAETTTPLIMAGLGTGLAPFRAFVQYRAMQKAAGESIGPILLYLGSRHQREEYLYGEEWEAYLAAGVVTLVGSAFSRDQAHKIYIQDRMRQTLDEIRRAYVREGGSFYLCGPTWPVPDVTAVLEEAIAAEALESGKRLDARREIARLKDEGRYVLEVY